jgi:hypothetical protein
MAIGYRIDERPPEYSRYVRVGQSTSFTLRNKFLDGTPNNEALTNVEIKVYTQGEALLTTALLSFNFASGISQVGNLISCNINLGSLPQGRYDWVINYVRVAGTRCVYAGFLDVSNDVRPNCDIQDTYDNLITINGVYLLPETLDLKANYYTSSFASTLLKNVTVSGALFTTKPPFVSLFNGANWVQTDTITVIGDTELDIEGVAVFTRLAIVY